MCDVCVDDSDSLAPQAKCIHFMINQNPIASKTIPAPLQVVLIGYLNCESHKIWSPKQPPF